MSTSASPRVSSRGLAFPLSRKNGVLKSLPSRQQRTIADSVEVAGVGFFTGANVRVIFQPAEANAGLVFFRTDLPRHPRIAATIANVSGANRRTTLGRPPSQVELVEHVLAALAGLRIDNCTMEIDGPELPGLDGSARG